MEQEVLMHNIRCLEREFQWLEQVMDMRFRAYFAPEDAEEPGFPAPPDLSADASTYAHLVRHYGMKAAERLVLGRDVESR